MARLKTKPGRLSDLARHVVLPSGIVSTGWPAVRDKCAEFGDEFDEWQDGAGRAILAKRADGIYAATVGGVTLSIPRQVAKTFLVMRIVVALCILFPGLTVLWTAHHGRTLARSFRSLQGLVRRKQVAPHIAAIRTTNGEQELRFTNGSILMFGAREQGFARGFEEVDIEVFDEAQILTEKALEDMVAATNQFRHPHGALLFYMGTPPRPTDNGEAFSLKRSKALSGKADDMVYIEFSADADADPDDVDQWAKANPSFPHRTPLVSMHRLRENLMSDDAWMREALGVWDQVGTNRVIPQQSWDEAGDESSLAVDRFALGVEVGPDQAWASVSLAGLRPDGAWHVELDDQRKGALWLGPYLAALLAANPQVRAVVGDVGGPLTALCELKNGAWTIRGTNVRITPMAVKELGSACSRLLVGIVDGSIRHTRQPQMSLAASLAGKRPLGDTGMWVWSRKSAESDITPIQAATYALWGAQSSTVKKPSRSDKPRRVVTG